MGRPPSSRVRPNGGHAGRENKMREFNVIPVLNGFIVKIGCQTVVFEGKQAIIDAVRDYVLYPEETEKEFLGHKDSERLY